MTEFVLAKGFFQPFVDPIGRVSDKCVTDEQGVTDNPLLFTGEAALLLSLTGRMDIQSMLFLEKVVMDCTVDKGLFRRHPNSMQTKYAIPRNKTSHDEYNGIMFMATAVLGMKRHAEDVVQYGKNYGWQFNDIHPRSNFFKALLNSPVDTIKKLKAYLADIKANPQDTNSVDLRHDGNIVALSSLRQPRDIAFYKLVAGQSPSLFSILWLCVAIILTSKTPINNGNRGGTILMAWFRNLALKKLNLRGFKGFLINKAIKIFESNMFERLGHHYPLIIARIYWDRHDPNGKRNPMIDLIESFLK